MHAEIVECRTEEYGGCLGGSIFFYIEFGINAVDEFDVVAELLSEIGSDLVVELFGGYFYFDGFGDALFVWGEEVEVLLVDVVDAFEAQALSDGP